MATTAAAYRATRFSVTPARENRSAWNEFPFFPANFSFLLFIEMRQKGHWRTCCCCWFFITYVLVMLLCYCAPFFRHRCLSFDDVDAPRSRGAQTRSDSEVCDAQRIYIRSYTAYNRFINIFRKKWTRNGKNEETHYGHWIHIWCFHHKHWHEARNQQHQKNGKKRDNFESIKFSTVFNFFRSKTGPAALLTHSIFFRLSWNDSWCAFARVRNEIGCNEVKLR